jgi:hypothetical protein
MRDVSIELAGGKPLPWEGPVGFVLSAVTSDLPPAWVSRGAGTTSFAYRGAVPSPRPPCREIVSRVMTRGPFLPPMTPLMSAFDAALRCPSGSAPGSASHAHSETRQNEKKQNQKKKKRRLYAKHRDDFS